MVIVNFVDLIHNHMTLFEFRFGLRVLFQNAMRQEQTRFSGNGSPTHRQPLDDNPTLFFKYAGIIIGGHFIK